MGSWPIRLVYGIFHLGSLTGYLRANLRAHLHAWVLGLDACGG